MAQVLSTFKTKYYRIIRIGKYKISKYKLSKYKYKVILKKVANIAIL